tara:strand:- start:150 stop:323 length:174 start_codon:yes stop_codon:yes gene_type:complete
LVVVGCWQGLLAIVARVVGCWFLVIVGCWLLCGFVAKRFQKNSKKIRKQSTKNKNFS